MCKEKVDNNYNKRKRNTTMHNAKKNFSKIMRKCYKHNIKCTKQPTCTEVYKCYSWNKYYQNWTQENLFK